MMSAKRYTIKLSGGTDTMINIPISLEPHITDQCELIHRKFVDVEVVKSINPILDYEKARFGPVIVDTTSSTPTFEQLDSVVYKVSFLSTTGFPTSTSMYSDIGITNDDIKFGKKRYENSHLNLSFYDSDRATDNRLLSSINIFPHLSMDDIQTQISGDPTPGLPKFANQIPVLFQLANPIRFPEGFAEGFYIYNYKDEVTSELPKELYMRARFNNAATGKATNLMTEGIPYGINELVNKLYTKYILYRDNTGYFYAIDQTYSNNVSQAGKGVTINLYEIQAL